MPDTKFATRLDIALTQAGIARGRLRIGRVATMFQVTRETARLWSKGRVPGIGTLRVIASRLQVSLDWLATGRGQPAVGGVSEKAAVYETIDPLEQELIGLIRTMSTRRKRALLALLAND